MQKDLKEARTTVAHAREQLAQHARKVLGMAPAQLFGHEPGAASSQLAPSVPEVSGSRAPATLPPGSQQS